MKKPLCNKKASNWQEPALRQVAAGFPSPAEDHLDKPLDLNEYLVKNKPATFFVRVKGHSMEGRGIYQDDIAIVDKSLEVSNGDIIVAIYNGGFIIKQIRKESGQIWLDSAHNDYPPILVQELDQFQVWGVVTNTIRRHKKI